MTYDKNKIVLCTSSIRINHEYNLIDLDNFIKDVIETTSYKRPMHKESQNQFCYPIDLSNKIFTHFADGIFGPIRRNYCFTDNIERAKLMMKRSVDAPKQKVDYVTAFSPEFLLDRCSSEANIENYVEGTNGIVELYFMFKDILKKYSNNDKTMFELSDEMGHRMFQIFFEPKY